MTDDLLARARQALERITPAPWTQVGFGNIHAEPVGDHPPVAKTWNRANGDFIASARTLIPDRSAGGGMGRGSLRSRRASCVRRVTCPCSMRGTEASNMPERIQRKHLPNP